MAQFVKVAALDEVPPGKGKTVLVHGREVTVYNDEGRYVATATWPRRLAGPLATETTCDLPGHTFDVDRGDSPARLRADELHYQVVVGENGVYVVLEEGQALPGEEPHVPRHS